MKKIKVKSKFTDYIGYFRFFAQDHSSYFWHTPTLDNTGFDMSRIADFEPLNITWDELRKKNP